LYLEGTNVKNLAPLTEARLQFLNLKNTPVEDITPLKDQPLNTLWLVGTKVKSLEPLVGKTLISLDVENTTVEDLSPLRKLPSLERLNIAGSAVTDLTPLQGLRLNRLIFTPEKISKGLNVARSMPTLKEIGPTLKTATNPAKFWAMRDQPELPGR